MLDELGDDYLLLDGHRLLVADEVDQLVRIVEEVVLPWILRQLELLASVVLLLRCINLPDDVLEWF